MITPLNHYSIANPATVFDEDSMTVLELCARLAGKVNEIVGVSNDQGKEIDNLKTVIDHFDMSGMGEFISEWLKDHPEDEVTMAKFITEVLGYVTPQMFGAKGDNTTDDTEAIRKAISFIGPGCNTLYLPAGYYLVSGDIQLVSNMNLYGDGKETVIHRAGNNLTEYAILDLIDVSRITIENIHLKGDRENHTGESGEWGMGIQMKNAHNITIRNVTCLECWGDGLYIGSNGEGVGCSQITIEKSTMHFNRRNGMSIINAKNVRISQSYFTDNRGTDPQAGLCFEPNNTGEAISGAIIDGCIFDNNMVDISASVHQDADVKFTGCVFYGKTGLAFNSTNKTTKVNTPQMVFSDCEFFNKTNCVNLYRKNAQSVPLTFRGCQFSCDNVAIQIGGYGLEYSHIFGTIFFYNCQLMKNSDDAASIRFQVVDDGTTKLVDCVFQFHFDLNMIPWLYFTAPTSYTLFDITGGYPYPLLAEKHTITNNLYPLLIARTAGGEVSFTSSAPRGYKVKIIAPSGTNPTIDGTSRSKGVYHFERTEEGWLEG